MAFLKRQFLKKPPNFAQSAVLFRCFMKRRKLCTTRMSRYGVLSGIRPCSFLNGSAGLPRPWRSCCPWASRRRRRRRPWAPAPRRTGSERKPSGSRSELTSGGCAESGRPASVRLGFLKKIAWKRDVRSLVGGLDLAAPHVPLVFPVKPTKNGCVALGFPIKPHTKRMYSSWFPYKTH